MIVYRIFLLPAMLRWGASNEELEKTYPGDELVKYDYSNTVAVTVNAKPSDIWPWVAQMGLHKGGFYSYTWLENIFGCKLNNAEFINPAWQYPVKGEIEPVCASEEGKGGGWKISVVEKNHALVWTGVNNAQWMMGVYIDSIDLNKSRLVTRQRFKTPKFLSMSWWLEKIWFEWAHCVMQHGMINGIKDRAEKLKQ